MTDIPCHFSKCNIHRRGGRRAGFSMVEVIVSVIVVALMVSAAMRTVAVSRVAQYRLADRSRGQMLADDLMAEILQKNYKDPSGGTTFGPESGELTRAQFNDVDDYNAWVESPPKNPDGTSMAGFTSGGSNRSGTWKRAVDVAWVSATDPTTSLSTETGMKRITVTVTRSGMVVARRVAVRGNAP